MKMSTNPAQRVFDVSELKHLICVKYRGLMSPTAKIINDRIDLDAINVFEGLVEEERAWRQHAANEHEELHPELYPLSENYEDFEDVDVDAYRWRMERDQAKKIAQDNFKFAHLKRTDRDFSGEPTSVWNRRPLFANHGALE